MATDYSGTENNTNEENNHEGKHEESDKRPPSVILPWLVAALGAGLFFAPPGTVTSIKIVTLILMCAAVVAAVIKAKGAVKLRGRRAISILMLPAVPVGLLGAAFGWQVERSLGAEAIPNGTPTITVSNILHFSDRPYMEVPFCRSYYGTGTIPAGDSLLIFDSPADDNWDLKEPVQYAFHGVADPQPNGGWIITNVDILGPSNAGAHAVLFGVLETNQDAEFVKRITIYSKSNGSYWRSGSLPHGFGRIALPVTVSDRTECG